MFNFCFRHRLCYFLIGWNTVLLFSSCTLHRLEVQTQYFSHENLASYHVGTPDPYLDHPPIGQRLLIQWSLSSQEIENQPLFLYLTIRFRNHQEQALKVLIEKKKGTYLYNLKDEAYGETQGILTYKAEIRNESGSLASWIHPLWAELITFDFSDSSSSKLEKSISENE